LVLLPNEKTYKGQGVALLVYTDMADFEEVDYQEASQKYGPRRGEDLYDDY